MGQSQGKKTNVDDTIEVKSLSSEGGCADSESSGAKVKDPYSATNRGVFMRLRKSLRERATIAKVAGHGSVHGSLEDINIGKDSSGSELTLDIAAEDEHNVESKDCKKLHASVSPVEVSEVSYGSLKPDGKDRRRSADGKTCSIDEKDLDKLSIASAPKPAKGDSGSDEGPAERESGKSPTKEEEVPMEEQIQKLETPLKWLQEFISNESFYNTDSCEMSDGNRDFWGGKKPKWCQDHFRVSTYHLWLSARFYLVDGNPHKALKELSLSKKANDRFSDFISNQDSHNFAGSCSSEDQRGDEDVVKALGMVIDGTIATISFKMDELSDATRILKMLRKQQVSQGVRAAFKGIEASVVACMESCLLSAVNIARQAVGMAPDYWRWHALLGLLLQRVPEAEDPNQEAERVREMLDAMEAVCQLEPNNANRYLYLADAYRGVAFQVRKRRDLDEDFKEYAKKAISAYMAAVDRAPKSAQIHVSAARSLWNLRRLRPEASQRAIVIAERASRALTDAERDDLGIEDSRSNAVLEGHSEAALALGLVWELIGNGERAVCLYRMAATNPLAPANVAYRAELGIIVSNFQRGKCRPGNPDSKPNNDVLCQLNKLMAKFTDNDFQQQTLCHKGHYLMVIMKDSKAALDCFCKAASIKPESPFLKRYYPRFSSSYAHPIRISDLIHELACKELARIQVRASKGSPEAVRRADQLNDQIQLAQDMSRARADAGSQARSVESSNHSNDASPAAVLLPPIIEGQAEVQKADALGVDLDMGEVGAGKPMVERTVVGNEQQFEAIGNEEVVEAVGSKEQVEAVGNEEVVEGNEMGEEKEEETNRAAGSHEAVEGSVSGVEVSGGSVSGVEVSGGSVSGVEVSGGSVSGVEVSGGSVCGQPGDGHSEDMAGGEVVAPVPDLGGSGDAGNTSVSERLIRMFRETRV